MIEGNLLAIFSLLTLSSHHLFHESLKNRPSVYFLKLCFCCSVTRCTVACQVSLSSTISQSLLKFMSIESVMLSNHLIICSPLLLLPAIFPSFPVSWLFVSGGQRVAASALASIPPMNIHGWFHLGLTGLILQFKGFWRVFEIISFSVLSLFYGPALTSICDYWKNHSIDYIDLCWQGDVSAFYFFIFFHLFLLVGG